MDLFCIHEGKPLSFADALKNGTNRKRYNSECTVQMSWFEQVEEFEHEVTMLRSKSAINVSNNNEIFNEKSQTMCSSYDSLCGISNASIDLKMSYDSDLQSFDESNEDKLNHSFDQSESNQIYKRRSSFDSHDGTASSSGCSSANDNKNIQCKPLFETDEAVLARRQKQIDYGKRTVSYRTYRKKVAKQNRGIDDPKTPNKHLKYSRRAFDGLIKVWRKRLHIFDPDYLMKQKLESS